VLCGKAKALLEKWHSSIKGHNSGNIKGMMTNFKLTCGIVVKNIVWRVSRQSVLSIMGIWK
jgi:hypothetical protein